MDGKPKVPTVADFAAILAQRAAGHTHSAVHGACCEHEGHAEAPYDVATASTSGLFTLGTDGFTAEDFAALRALGEGVTIHVDKRVTPAVPVASETVRPAAPSVAITSASESDEEPCLAPAIREILREFRELHRERVHTYRSFEECVALLGLLASARDVLSAPFLSPWRVCSAFSVLLHSEDFSSYNAVVADVTAAFSRISKAVISCEVGVTRCGWLACDSSS